MNLSNLLFPALIVLLIVPLLLNGRRQKREMEAAKQLQGDLTEGDVVTTTSGLRGTVVDASYEDTIDLEIAPGVTTTWLRGAVRDKVKPDTPADPDAPADGEPRTGPDTPVEAGEHPIGTDTQTGDRAPGRPSS